MSKFAVKRNGELVKHVVFEASNDNYPASNVVVLTLDTFAAAEKFREIWPGIEVVELKNNLLE